MDILQCRSLKEASYSPDFYRFMTVGLRDTLLLAYLKYQAKTTYERLIVPLTSNKNKEGYPSIGLPSLPERVQPGEAYPEKKIGDDDLVEITNADFGEIIAIHQNLIDDDQTGAIAMQPNQLGEAMRKKEDKTVYSIINGNPTTYDSNAFFSLNHPGITGAAGRAENDNIYTNVTLSANAVAVVLGVIGGWTGATAEDDLDVMATDLVVPKNLQMTANLLTQSDFLPLAYAAGALGPAASVGAGKNVLKEAGLGVIASQRLDKTSTTDWYVKTDFPGIGFQTRQELQVTPEQEAGAARFERKLLRWRADKRWQVAVINWRGFFKIS